jgi:hypothetical protein
MFDQECAKIMEAKNRKYRSMIQQRFTRAATEEYSEGGKKKAHKRTRRNIMKNNLNGYESVM